MENVEIIASRIKSEVKFSEQVQKIKFADKPIWRNLNVTYIRDALDLAMAISFNDLVAAAFFVETETACFKQVTIEEAWEAFRKVFP